MSSRRGRGGGKSTPQNKAPVASQEEPKEEQEPQERKKRKRNEKSQLTPPAAALASSAESVSASQQALAAAKSSSLSFPSFPSFPSSSSTSSSTQQLDPSLRDFLHEHGVSVALFLSPADRKGQIVSPLSLQLVQEYASRREFSQLTVRACFGESFQRVKNYFDGFIRQFITVYQRMANRSLFEQCVYLIFKEHNKDEVEKWKREHCDEDDDNDVDDEDDEEDDDCLSCTHAVPVPDPQTELALKQVRELVKQLVFPEMPMVLIGTGTGIGRGHGVRPSLASSVLYRVSTLLLKLMHPTHHNQSQHAALIFGTFNIFDSKFGRDAMNDMTVFIVLRDILNYTDKVCRAMEEAFKQGTLPTCLTFVSYDIHSILNIIINKKLSTDFGCLKADDLYSRATFIATQCTGTYMLPVPLHQLLPFVLFIPEVLLDGRLSFFAGKANGWLSFAASQTELRRKVLAAQADDLRKRVQDLMTPIAVQYAAPLLATDQLYMRMIRATPTIRVSSVITDAEWDQYVNQYKSEPYQCLLLLQSPQQLDSLHAVLHSAQQQYTVGDLRKFSSQLLAPSALKSFLLDDVILSEKAEGLHDNFADSPKRGRHPGCSSYCSAAGSAA